MSGIKSLGSWLWSREIPESPEKLRWLTTTYVFIFATVFPITFIAFMPHFAFLGPGLGEPTDSNLLAEFYAWLIGVEWSLTSQVLAIAVIALMAFGVVFRGWIMLRSYTDYRDENGGKYPQQQIVVFSLVNLVGVIGIVITLLVTALVMQLAGYSFADGLQLVATLSLWAHEQVMLHVPTVVELPTPIALLFVYVIATFLHYWAHRLSHSLRAGWLLFHRLHHLPPILSPVVTLPVYFAFPLFLLMVVPYNFVFAATTKLFAENPLYMETILLNLLVVVSEIYGHSTATYHEGRKNPVIRWLGHAFLNGPYHYLHHSAKPGDAGRSGAVNMINIGMGPFGLWDRVFGTYMPLREEQPPVGLTGSPDIHMNPVRIALAGVTQILYELKHNKSWRTRFWILFGSSAWNPPISKDFIVREVAAQPAVNADPSGAAPTAG